MKIAIQGAAGSFHHIAAEKYFGRDTTENAHDFVYADTYTAIFATLAAGAADVAVIDVENSLYGSIPEVYHLLVKHRFPIVGEIVEMIHHNLITFPDAKTQDIQRIYSHPVALAQCAHYLASHFPRVEIVQHQDTAAAVEYIKRNGDHTAAAIAGSVAAELHDMYILEREIQDETHNFSRFLVIEPAGTPPQDANKASLVMTVPDEAGALHRALGVFADLGSNLLKIRSHPVGGKIHTYQFYIDLQITPHSLESAIEMLALQHCTVINLGTYKAATILYED